MSKIKITLASGGVVEKPLVTCFKGTNGTYVVLDNESNGQMGYPIIGISKFTGTALEKIVDQGEWGAVKENLKTIISGTALPYIKVPEMLTAPDDFFTQLTLPVNSFDLLKKTYIPVDDTASAGVMPSPMPQQPMMPNPAPVEPVAPAAPVMENPTSLGMPSAQMPMNSMGVSPIGPMPMGDMSMQYPQMQPMPQSNPVPMSDPSAMFQGSIPPISNPMMNNQAMPQMPENNMNVGMNQTMASPMGYESPVNMSMGTMPNNNIEALKESFMKSCENMFDALIKNFENK